MAKRGHGEGTIYKRKDGRWSGQITVGFTEKGSLKRRTVYGRTRAEVVAKMTDMQVEAQQMGRWTEVSHETVEEYLLRWVDEMVQYSRRPNTFKAYRHDIKTHINPEIGRIKLHQLSPEHVQAFYNRKIKAGYAPKYVRNMHGVLHRALEHAVKWGLIPRNVTKAVELPRVEKKKMNVFTVEEANCFLMTATHDRLYPLYVVAIMCGLRLRELFGLTWDCIDFDEGYLQVQHQLQKVNGVLDLVPLKTSRSRRRIDLPTMVLKALKIQRRLQAKERLAAGEVWSNELNLVFTTEIGTPLNGSNVRNRSFYPLMKRAKVPRIRFHDLRHTCATLLLAAGENPKAVSEMLGHSSVAFTLDTYSHVIPSMRKDLANRMEHLLVGVQGS